MSTKFRYMTLSHCATLFALVEAMSDKPLTPVAMMRIAREHIPFNVPHWDLDSAYELVYGRDLQATFTELKAKVWAAEKAIYEVLDLVDELDLPWTTASDNLNAMLSTLNDIESEVCEQVMDRHERIFDQLLK